MRPSNMKFPPQATETEHRHHGKRKTIPEKKKNGGSSTPSRSCLAGGFNHVLLLYTPTWGDDPI